MMIRHRVVDGVPKVDDVRILSTNLPAIREEDTFWTCVAVSDGSDFEEALNAMLLRVRTEPWLAWARPYVEAGHAHVR
jgi:hypothetical protein